MKFTDTLKSLEAKADKSQYYAHLCNHAQEIINLVEAAERLRDSEPWVNQLAAVDGVKKALAALNKGQV